MPQTNRSQNRQQNLPNPASLPTKGPPHSNTDEGGEYTDGCTMTSTPKDLLSILYLNTGHTYASHQTALAEAAAQDADMLMLTEP